MSREMIQNIDGSFFIYNRHINLPTGPRHAYRDEDLGWDTNGYLGILTNSVAGRAAILPIIKPLPERDSTPNYDLTLGQREFAKELGGLVNRYAFQAEIVRDDNGNPAHLSTRTHITLIQEHENGEGQRVLDPVVTLLDYKHPAHPDYDEGLEAY